MASIRPRLGALFTLLGMSVHSYPSLACTTTTLAHMPISMYHSVPLVGVTVNGHTLPFILDTGAEYTVMTPTAAAEIGLKPDHSEITQIQGISANPQAGWNYDADYQSITIGAYSLGPGLIHVTNFQNPEFAAGIAGALGADILDQHDLILDIPDQFAEIVQINDCAGDFIPWSMKHDDLVGAWVNSQESELGLPSTLEGTPLKSFLDTGDSQTMISISSASATGLTQAAIDTSSASSTIDATGIKIPTLTATLQDLTIGNENFPKVAASICNCIIPNADIQLGEDYISSRRLWLSYGTGQVFVTRPPSTPAQP